MIAEAGSGRGLIRELADVSGCQRSYFSQVLGSHVQLTNDHAYGLCAFWKWGEIEREYFLALVEFARSASKTYRSYLEERMRELKSENENLTRLVSHAQPPASEIESIYYSSWHWLRSICW